MNSPAILLGFDGGKTLEVELLLGFGGGKTLEAILLGFDGGKELSSITSVFLTVKSSKSNGFYYTV